MSNAPDYGDSREVSMKMLQSALEAVEGIPDTAPAMNTPSTGPIPRDEFFSLVDAPYGRAAQVIRRYDPLWGRPKGDLIKWRVTVSRTVTEAATFVVEAASAAEAEDKFSDLSDQQIADLDWEKDIYSADYEIDSVEPVP